MEVARMKAIQKVTEEIQRTLYRMLITGSGEIYFNCMCLRSKKKEETSSNIMWYGLQLLKINLIYRIPGIKRMIPKVTIGESIESRQFVRAAPHEQLPLMLQNECIIVDLFGSAILQIKSKDEIYEEVEKCLNVKGFAKLRKKYHQDTITIQEI